MTELEKAAANHAYGENTVQCFVDEPTTKEEVELAFISGAQWQAKQSPWISVEERLPNPSKLVNVRCRNKNKEDGIWLYDVCLIDEDTNTWRERHHTWETITHWSEIPE